MTYNDNDLEKRIVKALEECDDLDEHKVKVKESNEGKVILTGTVDVLEEKNKARETVETVEGVKNIENNLVIATKGQIYDGHVHMDIRKKIDAEEVIDDASLVNEIRQNLSHQGLGRNLEITSNDGHVIISGVAGINERNKAYKVASRVPGVRNVEVHLVDTERGEMDRAQRVAEEVKSAFQEDESLKKLPVDIYEREGHLVLDGEIDNLTQKNKIDRLLHSLMENTERS